MSREGLKRYLFPAVAIGGALLAAEVVREAVSMPSVHDPKFRSCLDEGVYRTESYDDTWEKCAKEVGRGGPRPVVDTFNYLTGYRKAE